jgi:hypothetical protein
MKQKENTVGFHFVVTDAVNKALPIDLKIAATLWKLATNVDYRTIGHLFGIARSTACMVFHDVVDGVNEILTPKFIRCPTADMFRASCYSGCLFFKNCVLGK